MSLKINFMNDILNAITHAHDGDTAKSTDVHFPTTGYIGLLTALPTGYGSNGKFANYEEVPFTVPEYDPEATYAVGDYCRHTDTVEEQSVTKKYKCKTAGTTGAWDASKWDDEGENLETGYVRISLTGKGLSNRYYFETPASGNFNDGSSIKNSDAIIFPESITQWGTIVGFALFEGLTDDTMYLFGNLQNAAGQPTSQAIAAAQVAVFSARDLELTLA